MRSFAAFVLLATMVAAGPTAKPMSLVHERPATPKGFVKTTTADPDHVMSLRFHLKKGDRDGLAKKVGQVSTPGHANYGKFLSKAEVEAYVRPKAQTTGAVKAWFAAHGLEATDATPAGDVLEVKVPVHKANQMLSANYHSFVHANSGEKTTRTLSYSLPSDMLHHISAVEPTTSFFTPHQPPSVAFMPEGKANTARSFVNATAVAPKTKRDGCDQITPSCLQGLYGLPSGADQGSGHSSLAVGGFIGQYANSADLQSFLSGQRGDLNPQPGFNVQLLEDGQNSQDPGQAGVEANLDIQYTVGLAGITVPTTFISVGSGGDGNGFWNIVKDLLAQESVPLVLTHSYGMGEGGYDPNGANEMCDTFMQLGARGVSVIYSSGDSGVGSDQQCSAFEPTYPSGCQYVTSVGGTDGTNPEKVAGFSTGGFSNIFSVPDFQKDVVQNYINGLGDTYKGMYNAGGRAFPDVAAQGTNLPVVSGGQNIMVGGTSASAPIFAATIAMLNDELLKAGKSPLGWLNPFLYANPGAFTDVTEGSNPGCGTNGFSAAQGWDPATGLGTPIYSALRSAAGL
jgi:tripeptidyl-peptidase-1